MECRSQCGACCIVPSITSSIPGMPKGKQAHVPCIQLDENFRCKIFNSSERPLVCGSLKPTLEMCGNCREDAFSYLEHLEDFTAP